MWSSQEEVLLLAFRQKRQIFLFFKWGFIDEIFCKGSALSWTACRNKKSSCEWLLCPNRGSSKKANKEWKKLVGFCWVRFVWFVGLFFGFIFFLLCCLVSWVYDVCLFIYLSIYFIIYFLKVFRNIPCPSSEQILSVSFANAFSGSTQIFYRTGKWWDCRWFSSTMLLTQLWPSPFDSQSKPSCWTLRGPHTSASPGNALSVSGVNNIALICQVTSGLSVEAKDYYLWKCCVGAFSLLNSDCSDYDEEQLRMRNLASPTSPLFLEMSERFELWLYWLTGRSPCSPWSFNVMMMMMMMGCTEPGEGVI